MDERQPYIPSCADIMIDIRISWRHKLGDLQEKVAFKEHR